MIFVLIGMWPCRSTCYYFHCHRVHRHAYFLTGRKQANDVCYFLPTAHAHKQCEKVHYGYYKGRISVITDFTTGVFLRKWKIAFILKIQSRVYIFVFKIINIIFNVYIIHDDKTLQMIEEHINVTVSAFENAPLNYVFVLMSTWIF